MMSAGIAPSLRFLHLGNCGLGGPLPPSWANSTHLANLEVLNLFGWVVIVHPLASDSCFTAWAGAAALSFQGPIFFQEPPYRAHSGFLD